MSRTILFQNDFHSLAHIITHLSSTRSLELRNCSNTLKQIRFTRIWADWIKGPADPAFCRYCLKIVTVPYQL